MRREGLLLIGLIDNHEKEVLVKENAQVKTRGQKPDPINDKNG